MDRRFWDGKTVHVTTLETMETYRDPRSVEVGLTPETAGQLANLLRKQGGLANLLSPLPDGLQELMTALDYVLVADPASVHAHSAMLRGSSSNPAVSATGIPRPRPFRATDAAIVDGTVRDGE